MEHRRMPGQAGACGVEGGGAIEEKLKEGCINICFPVPRETLRREKIK